MHFIYNQNTSYKHKGTCHLSSQHPAQHIRALSAHISHFYPRNLVAQLQDVINKLTSQRPYQMSVPDTAQCAHDQEKLDPLVPDQPGLQPLRKEDYPDVPYWREESWVKYTEEQRERGKVPSKLGFLTDDDGNPVLESRIKTFMSIAKQAWNELYRLRLDPSSWTKKTPQAALYFTHILRKNYDEFRYCDGDWKVERFAIVKYPDWCRDARESGRLTRASNVFSDSLISSDYVCSRR
jgi:hypothetical protein